MIARPLSWPIVILSVLLLLAACAPPHSLPAAPTPIPTLIPATLPASLPGSVEQASFSIQSYPARLPSSALGESIYQRECSGCHGEDGGGLVAGARNFNDLDYMRGETPASFYTAITEGRGEMPAFRDRLTSDERWDVVFYIWRFSTTLEALALGQQVYETSCAACHGADGTGEVLGAADFTDLRLVDDRAPRDFYQAVTQGVGSMPAWQGRLSQNERWAVIDYLRTFSYDPGPEYQGLSDTSSNSEPVETTCDQALLSQSNPFEWDDPDAIAAGGVIYQQSCAMCHGENGAGGVPNIPDFTSSSFHSELVDSSGLQLCVLAEGRGSMPGWQGTLSTEEMWQVLTFLASLGQ